MPADPTTAAVEAAARAICRERCAFMGEPACWEISDEWPNPNCDDPGCVAMAEVALDAIPAPPAQEGDNA